MAVQETTLRPSYLGPDWLRCTDGYSFIEAPPAKLNENITLSSQNMWERVVCVTLQAQSGDFRNVESLLEIIRCGSDVHIRDSAIRVFAQAAPSSIVTKLADVFDHHDPDARLEAYASSVLTCDLRLAEILASHRTKTKLFEHECVMSDISKMLEPDTEELEFADSNLSDSEFEHKVRERIQHIRKSFGSTTAIFRGELLSPSKLIEAIAELCQEDDAEENGGYINQLFSMLEGVTGVQYAGCIDDDCSPVLRNISQTLNNIEQDGILKNFEPGVRYFFGHRIPD
jgi:hypothetical protein